MALLRLGYVSTAVSTIQQQDLDAIARESDIRNKRDDITGFLLFDSIHFIQVIEGAHDMIAALYRSLEKDPRHRGMLVILEEDIDERAFDTWIMRAHHVIHRWDEVAKALPNGLPASVVNAFTGAPGVGDVV